ncbi:hypothetical protein PaG_01898 [Moesziomyces aphidis]|uniref:JmjC domain-containing protein n=1 Tax=Moesziomyces aphidis TaxID=84754 RepID=W3VPW1_MOEAP|nr:hypothetical protein PaG_01898 [Moesziomyces aphidis]
MGAVEDEVVIRFETAPSYREFFERCLVANRPCILPRSLISHWPVEQSRAWASPHDGSINWSALKLRYGSQTAPVVVIRTNAHGDEKEDRQEMTISDAIDLILAHRTDPCNIKAIYIKDWHLIKQLHSDASGARDPYVVPEIFEDDWMNNVGAGGDDFRFVYAGTAGSQTLLHRDVYTSYSWSTNVVGRKRWHLFPPRVVAHLRRFPAVETSPMVPDIQTLQNIIDAATKGKEYSELHKAWKAVQVVDQQEGETIFVPSNWWHEVHNVGECISINRNWCNAVNVPSLYRSIEAELEHVERSLCDVHEMLQSNNTQGEEWRKEFYTLVQDVAVQDAGWAWDGFWKMVLRNLRNPPTGSRCRPDAKWVRTRILPLAQQFETRQDAHWLDASILDTARRCRQLLEGHME